MALPAAAGTDGAEALMEAGKPDTCEEEVVSDCKRSVVEGLRDGGGSEEEDDGGNEEEDDL